ncbi:YdcF family protein [Romboutsia sp.]|uniref:YdcF family protein n=1 Tax=Romboutsia sp. TaxID=1965302 RepID=UPI003F669DA1
MIYGGLVFSEFFVILAVGIVVYHFIKDKLKENKLLYKLFKTSLCLLLSLFLIIESMLVFYPKNNTKDKSDYMIILGAAVQNNSVSLTLKGRLDAALTYLDKTNDDLYIVVSGGKGSGENISEALAMKNYLLENGIAKDKILMENKSTNTYENFKYSKDLIESHSNKNLKDLKIKVVTTDFHSCRSSLLAKRTGYKNVTFYTSNSLVQFMPTYYAREFFAFFKTILLDR